MPGCACRFCLRIEARWSDATLRLTAEGVADAVVRGPCEAHAPRASPGYLRPSGEGRIVPYGVLGGDWTAVTATRPGALFPAASPAPKLWASGTAIGGAVILACALGGARITAA